jgi:AcrR family transcriptional regulator
MAAPAARRPGPRSDVDVPSLLVETAERMFADQGIGAVSLRAVAREAGVAPAAVSYHFASKQDLVRAVVLRRDGVVGDQTRARLGAVIDAREEVTVRDLVDAMMMPLVAVVEADPIGGLRWLKVFSRLALTDDPIFVEIISREPNLPGLFEQASRRVMPDLDDPGRRRVGLGIYSMITALAGVDLTGYGHPLCGDGTIEPDFVEQLGRFTTAGITLGG